MKNSELINNSVFLDKKNRSFGFILAMFICLTICSAIIINYLSKQNYPQKPLNIKSKINPNTAPVGSLTRLTGIGLIKASDIVEYRKSYKKKNNSRPFNNADDLQKIRGIGPKTVEKLRNYIEID